MKLVKPCRKALCGVYLVLGLVSACGGNVAADPSGLAGSAGNGSGAGGQEPAGPVSNELQGSWWLSALTEGGQAFPRQPEYSYNWEPDHPEIELEYLVFTSATPADALTARGLFSRWQLTANLVANGVGGCAFSGVTTAEYPPFELLEPLAADFCPDACFAARDTFERVLLSVVHCELSDEVLTFSNEDRTNAATFVASDYDLSGILN